MHLTLEELERRAYANGDLTLARALQIADDELEDRVDAAVAVVAEQAYDDGYGNGVASCQ